MTAVARCCALALLVALARAEAEPEPEMAEFSAEPEPEVAEFARLKSDDAAVLKFKTTNVTVFRVTPITYPGIENMDSGDEGGDVMFGLSQLLLPQLCAIEPSVRCCSYRRRRPQLPPLLLPPRRSRRFCHFCCRSCSCSC